MVSMTVGLAQDQRMDQRPFAVKTERLAKYLELRPHQMNEAMEINDYFIELQEASLRGNGKTREKRMRQAVYGNLRLMKQALTPDQYRKYVTLLNITNNNRLLGVYSCPDVYLADNTER